MKHSFSKPVLLITFGYPGSGKSTFAQHFSAGHGLVHIGSDRIRYELFDDPQYTPAEENVVTHLMDYMLEQTIKAGVSAIYDYNVSTKKNRQILKDTAAKHNVTPLVVWIQTDKETSQYRSMNRDRRRAEDRYSFPLSRSQFDSFSDKMKKPGEKEASVVVSGKHAFRTQSLAILNKLKRLGIYPVPPEDTALPLKYRTGRVDPTVRQLRPQDVGRG